MCGVRTRTGGSSTRRRGSATARCLCRQGPRSARPSTVHRSEILFPNARRPDRLRASTVDTGSLLSGPPHRAAARVGAENRMVSVAPLRRRADAVLRTFSRGGARAAGIIGAGGRRALGGRDQPWLGALPRAGIRGAARRAGHGGGDDRAAAAYRSSSLRPARLCRITTNPDTPGDQQVRHVLMRFADESACPLPNPRSRQQRSRVTLTKSSAAKASCDQGALRAPRGAARCRAWLQSRRECLDRLLISWRRTRALVCEYAQH